MKRLMKMSSDEKTYEFHSPIIINFGDDDSWKSYTEPLKTAKEYESVVAESVDDSMAEMGPSGLETYLDYDYRKLEKDIIKSIIVTVKNYEAVTIVKATRELTSKELDIIKDYITGQFSDGWGEGFEQEQLDSYQDSYDEEVEDEETGEYYTEPVEYTTTISASFYDSKNWSITLK